MKQSSFPAKFALPFAGSAGAAYIRTIPQASQIGVTAGAASLTDGFPPVTFDPVSAGGTPPSGADMNGILNWVTSVLQAYQSGYFGAWDGTFATSIGGYPMNAIVSGAVAGTYYVSTTDDNMTTPGASGAAWQSLFAGLATSDALQKYSAVPTVITSSTTIAVPAWATRVWMRVVAAGGGGMGCEATSTNGIYSGAGGGSGGHMIGIGAVIPGDILSVSIGAGGVGTTIGISAGKGGRTTVTSSSGTVLASIDGAGGGSTSGSNASAGGMAGPVGDAGSLNFYINAAGSWGSDGQNGAHMFAGNGAPGILGGGGRAGATGGYGGSAAGAGGGGAYDGSISGHAFTGGGGAAACVWIKFLP